MEHNTFCNFKTSLSERFALKFKIGFLYFYSQKLIYFAMSYRAKQVSVHVSNKTIKVFCLCDLLTATSSKFLNRIGNTYRQAGSYGTVIVNMA